MNRMRPISHAILVCLCAIALARADAVPDAIPATDPALVETLRQLEQKRGPIEDLTAKFTQERVTSLLRKPIHSRGIVRLKGSQMRWEVKEPSPSIVHRTEEELRIYLPEDKVVEVYPIGSKAEFAWGSNVLDTAALAAANRIERIDAEDGEIGLRLTLREESMREFLEHIDLVINETSGLVKRVRMVEGGGESTLVTFEDIQINTGLKDEDVALVLPEDVTVSRPLGTDEK